MKNLKNLVIISLLIVALGSLFVMCGPPSDAEVCEHMKEVDGAEFSGFFEGDTDEEDMRLCKEMAKNASDKQKECAMKAENMTAFGTCLAK